MKQIGIIVLSYEEAGDLSGLIPWKIENPHDVFAQLKTQGIPITGLVYLSTCNRVEFIYSIADAERHTDLVLALTQIMPPLERGIRPQALQGRKALTHLLRLSSGLESMVLGETEIRAQIKAAFDSSRTSTLIDQRLNILFRNIFQEARTIRSGIPMANLPLSVATLATKHLFRHEQTLHPDGAVVIIGSGPMSRQAAEYLSKENKRLILVNRTLEKVAPQAARIGASTLSFDDFLNRPEEIGPIGAIITATSRPDAFLTQDFIRRIIAANNGGYDGIASLALVDMAMPPDVEPSVSSIHQVALISMETLRQELQQNRTKRAEAAAQAEGLIEEALFRIEVNLLAGVSGPIISQLQKRIKDKSRHHLNVLLDERLNHLTKKDRKLIYTWAIQANREMNRIHRHGLECMLRNLYSQNHFKAKSESL
jgi:glutamyl-tRNA reductase